MYNLYLRINAKDESEVPLNDPSRQERLDFEVKNKRKVGPTSSDANNSNKKIKTESTNDSTHKSPPNTPTLASSAPTAATSTPATVPNNPIVHTATPTGSTLIVPVEGDTENISRFYVKKKIIVGNTSKKLRRGLCSHCDDNAHYIQKLKVQEMMPLINGWCTLEVLKM